MGVERGNGDELNDFIKEGNKQMDLIHLSMIKRRIENNYSDDIAAPWQIIEDRDWLLKTLERLLK